MIVTIELRYTTFGDNDELMQRNSFFADSFEFEVNPEKEAARLAFNWVDQIYRNNPYLSRVTRAICNDKMDVTALVQELWDKDMKKSFDNWRAMGIKL